MGNLQPCPLRLGRQRAEWWGECGKGEQGWAGTKAPFTVLQAQGRITCFPLAALASLYRGCWLGEICSGCRHQPRPHKRERERTREGKRERERERESKLARKPEGEKRLRGEERRGESKRQREIHGGRETSTKEHERQKL
jgi:hypothetical protein